ncbi:hypothetical protein B0J11DRAFT_108153 [Dendryphion nanum]|uniref:SMP-30/Gluconolactonase/LRE-like region domain-containing protein n=1 Tax=Dendryphion nanum TaxID=256645 RepID=A0A9P9ID01_9PLEO|nr:hypothetical protein B0J11DRAFT_108153 [Dendryphion nanum]
MMTYLANPTIDRFPNADYKGLRNVHGMVKILYSDSPAIDQQLLCSESLVAIFNMHVSAIITATVLPFSALSLQFSYPKTIYQFPNTTWLENIYATRNGSLLTGIIGVPELYLIDPSKTPATSNLVFTFPNVSAVFGIAELVPDTFAVAVGNFSVATGKGGGFSVWNIDLRRKTIGPTARKVTDIQNAQLLNGMISLNDRNLMIADSGAGHVVKLDVMTGKYGILIDHPSMKPVPGAALKIGINGIKIRNQYLYWTNTFQNTVSRVKIDRDGKAVGTFETISNNVSIPDDFALTEDGSIIVARPFANVVDRVTPDGKIDTIAGSVNSSDVAGSTAVALGRTAKDRGVAYISTNGGQSSPVNGTIEGGKIVAIDLC